MKNAISIPKFTVFLWDPHPSKRTLLASSNSCSHAEQIAKLYRKAGKYAMVGGWLPIPKTFEEYLSRLP